MDNQPTTILIVEDDEAMLLGINDLLEAMGVDGYEIEVLTAENGATALERMDECTPALIVSDINMPVMDGYAFFDAVRQHTEWLYIPFIFLTAQGEQEEIHRGRTSGADLYLTKPFNSIHLIELIKTQLDKAESRRLQREREGQNLKEGILKILNHEFRTPLTYVTASYEMLAESVSMHTDDQYFHDYLHGIRAGCVRLTHLVEELIMVIELRTGELGVRYEQEARVVDELTAVITPIIQQQKDRHSGDDISVYVHVNIDDDLPPILAVPSYLQQIVDQLLTNAVKFTRSHDSTEIHVTLSATATADELRISVRDEGIGIPEQVQSQIFDIFFQHNREYLEQQGAGMGLAIVDGLINLHGGYVEVESVEGEGSTFTAVFPVFHGDMPVAALSATAVYRRKATVLVVEDDAYLLRGLVDLLEIYYGKYEISVISAGNGRLALDILEKTVPTLILSDIMMPVMDGYGLLQAVRQNPAWIDIPFIFLTAKSEREDIFHGLQSGAEMYITKPYESDELLALIESELDKFFQKHGAQEQGFDELKRNILNLMSLDFRMPLADVSRYSESFSEELSDAQNEETMMESLRGIQAGNDLLTRLIENFIALAELKTGETAVAYQLRAYPIFDVGMFFDDAIRPYYALAARRNIICTSATIDDIPVIYGDATLLRKAFQRLVNVGLTHFPAGDDLADGRQELHQQLLAGKDDIQLSMRFTVPPSAEMQMLMERILTDYAFDPINKIEYAADLVIAKGYIELNNGRLHTTTNADGFTFTVTLPIYTIPDYDDEFVP